MKNDPAQYFSGPALALVHAALAHNPSAANAAIQEGADVNAQGVNGMRPIVFCILCEDAPGIALLQKLGADPLADVPGTGSAAIRACKIKNTAPLAALLAGGLDPNVLAGGAPLTFHAAIADRFDTALFLLDKGAGIDMRNTTGDTLLLNALLANDLDFAHTLIARGANVHIINRVYLSAAYELQKRMESTRGQGPDAPRYKALMTAFEARGIRFPVPSPVELKSHASKRVLTLEEAKMLNERGEHIEKK